VPANNICRLVFALLVLFSRKTEFIRSYRLVSVCLSVFIRLRNASLQYMQYPSTGYNKCILKNILGRVTSGASHIMVGSD